MACVKLSIWAPFTLVSETLLSYCRTYNSHNLYFFPHPVMFKTCTIKINSNIKLVKVRIYDIKGSRNCRIKPQKKISHTLLIFMPHTLLVFMNVVSGNIFTTLYKATWNKNHTITVTELHYCYLCCKTIWVLLEQSLALHIFSFVWYINMNNVTAAATVLVARHIQAPLLKFLKDVLMEFFGLFLFCFGFCVFCFVFFLRTRRVVFGNFFFFFTVLQNTAWHWISCQTIGWCGIWTNYAAAALTKQSCSSISHSQVILFLQKY